MADSSTGNVKAQTSTSNLELTHLSKNKSGQIGIADPSNHSLSISAHSELNGHLISKDQVPDNARNEDSTGGTQVSSIQQTGISVHYAQPDIKILADEKPIVPNDVLGSFRDDAVDAVSSPAIYPLQDVSEAVARRPRFFIKPVVDRNQLKNSDIYLPPVETGLAPPDGGWGWVVLVASVVSNILIPGFIKSFGVMFDDVAMTFNASTAEVAWVPALLFFMYNFMGLMGGVLSQHYSCRVTAILGGLMASTGLLVSYLADHIYYLYIGLGLLSGSGGSFVYSSGILVVGSYFERRRGLANGVCVSGSALGAMIFPPVLDLLLDQYGVNNSMLILCAVLLNVVPCALLYQPVEQHMIVAPAPCETVVSPPSSTPQLTPRGATGSGTPLFADRRLSVSAGMALHSPAATLSSASSVHSLCYLNTILHGSALAVSQRRESEQMIAAARRRRRASLLTTNSPHEPPPQTTVITAPTAEQKRPLIELTLLWNPVFLLILTSSALFQVAVSNLLIVLPSYTTQMGYSRQQASLLLSVVAGADLVGRVGGAALSDLRLVPRRCFLLGAYLLAGSSVAALPAATAFYASAAMVVAMAGVGTGVVMGIYSVMLIEYLGLERLGSTYGLSVCLTGLALLGGPPVFGMVRQRAPSPHLVIYLLALLPFLSAAVWLLMPAAQAHSARQQRNCTHRPGAEPPTVV